MRPGRVPRRASGCTKARASRPSHCRRHGSGIRPSGGGGGAGRQRPGRIRRPRALRAQGDDLAQKARSAELELYAIQSQLGQAQSRLAGLRGRRAPRRAARGAGAREARRREADPATNRRSSSGDACASCTSRATPIRSPSCSGRVAERGDPTIDNLDRTSPGRTCRSSPRCARRARSLRTSVARLAEQADRLEALDAPRRRRPRPPCSRPGTSARPTSRELARQKKLNQAQLEKLARDRSRAPSDEERHRGQRRRDAQRPEPAADRAARPAGTRMTVEATGYALPGTTATGIPVGWGVVAVDPSVIPLGHADVRSPATARASPRTRAAPSRDGIIDLWFPTPGPGPRLGPANGHDHDSLDSR